MSNPDSAEHNIACSSCDLLLSWQAIQTHEKALCPRCGNLLYTNISNSVEKTLALTLTGLLFFIPANLFPILQLSVLGRDQDNTLLSGSLALYNTGFYWIALLVLLFSIVIPLIKLLLMLAVSFSLYTRWPFRHQALYFRLYHHLDEWGMLEVYLLSILVAFVKLQDMAVVLIGTGFYCFIALLLITTFLSSLSDKQQFWEYIEQCQTLAPEKPD